MRVSAASGDSERKSVYRLSGTFCGAESEWLALTSQTRAGVGSPCALCQTKILPEFLIALAP